MKRNSGFSDTAIDITVYTIAIVLIVLTIYPLLYVLFASLSDAQQLVRSSGLLYKPLGFNLDAYRSVFNNPGIIKGYANTIFLIVAGVLVSLSITALGAYVLSRKNVFWSKYIMFFILFTMFFSGGLVPMYLIVRGVGLLDSLWSLIIPFAVSSFNLILMRTAFMTVPESLEESAKMDGANHLVIMFRIILPLCLPVIAVMILYYAVDKWNGWFYASIFLRDRDLYPLQLVLREILIENSTENMATDTATADQFQIAETIKYATIIVATVPVLCVYPFLQKYFAKGALIGAIKG